MSEQGGIQRYVYWSERRVRALLNDQNVTVQDKQMWRWLTPNFGNMVPTFEQANERQTATRPRLARMVEEALGKVAVADLDGPAPILYAKGRSAVVFGEFVVSNAVERALIFTTVRTEDDSDVAVCMFGSMENYVEYLTDASAPIKKGWSSSAAPDVHSFLIGENQWRLASDSDPEYVAREAVQIGYAQGVRGDDRRPGAFKPWNRAFTFGLSDEAEWLVQVYLDYDFRDTDQGPAYEHNRALIGAPLWVRTPSLRAVQLFANPPTEPYRWDSRRRQRWSREIGEE